MIYRESQIQKQIVRAIRYAYPAAVLFSIPNEGKRSVKYASALKANGLMHGVSDLVLLIDGIIIFIEVKSEKGKQTEYQKEFQDKIEKQGHRYWLVKSAEEVLTSLENLNLV